MNPNKNGGFTDFPSLIKEVNEGEVLLPWMLQNAPPNYLSYLFTVINSPDRRPDLLYKALDLIFTDTVDVAILAELVDVLDRNNFDSNELNFLKVVA